MHTLTIHANDRVHTISRHLYGHFSEHLGRCIYQGMYVGEDSPIPHVNGMRQDVVGALRQIHVPVLRWPGGCFADEYHWRDGIGPKDRRKRMVNTHWGNVVEDNSFGTHEFMELCRQIGCEPYVNGNLGSGTVREMSEWVEYLNGGGDSSVVRERRQNGRHEPFGVRYFGVGNENWGCGGNMRPEYYADEYRRYQTYCRDYGEHKLYRIACGAGSEETRWTEVLMENAAPYMDAITLHYYTVPQDWQHKGSATRFSTEDYYTTLQKALRMDDLISAHLAVMDKYDPEHRVGLIVDEWGTWYDVEPGTHPGFLYQQNTMRDAMVAALTLHIFNAHGGRVMMANLAQTVNVLQSLILTDGGQMVRTPTYHVFDLLKAHQDAEAVRLDIHGGPKACGMDPISASASVKEETLTLTVANLSADRNAPCTVRTAGFHAGSVTAAILTGAIDAYNDFGGEKLSVRPFEGFTQEGETWTAVLPPCSVTAFTCR